MTGVALTKALSSSEMTSSASSLEQTFPSTGTGITSSERQQQRKENQGGSSLSLLSAAGNVEEGNTRLEAAHALLGVSPETVAGIHQVLSSQQKSSSSSTQEPEKFPLQAKIQHSGLEALATLAFRRMRASATTTSISTTTTTSKSAFTTGESSFPSVPPSTAGSSLTIIAPPTANSVLISSNPGSDEDDADSEAMPPPPPRRRMRSASNPEGMEKWDSLSHRTFERRHFVLPTRIIEEELAEAQAATEAKQEERRRLQQQQQAAAAAVAAEMRQRVPGAEVVDLPMGETNRPNHISPPALSEAHSSSVVTPLEEDEPSQETQPSDDDDVDKSNMSPEQILRLARSRLLEDLSEGSLHGEKGVLTLPHSLNKYKHVYNKGGRIGIYTPAERSAIIARFQSKRARRVWNKKIRYNCRKNLADRRLRVKGRFVKRTAASLSTAFSDVSITPSDKTAPITVQTTLGIPPKVVESTTLHNDNGTAAEVTDHEMPDVNDKDAGFCPTEDQPYRRLRRHTIT